MSFSVGVISFFIIIIIIGLVVSRRIVTVEDYFVSGRNAPTILVAGSLIASFFSTVAFMGEVGTAYEGYPIIMLTLSGINVSGYLIGALFFGRYLRRSEALTLPQFFGERFNSIRVRRVAALTTVIGMGAYLMAVTQGTAILMEHLLGVNFIVALIIVWVTYTSFTFLSGAKGVLLTDTIMYFLFSVAAFISMPFILENAGGWPEAISKTAQDLVNKPDILSWHGITGENAYLGLPHEAFIWAVILGVAWTVVVAISPWQSSRYLMAKNEHVIMRTAAVATISILSVYIVLHITMASVNIINPDIAPSEMVFIWAAENILPNWVGIIVISGILAAGLSSASTFLQLIGNSLANDLFYLKAKKSKDEQVATLKSSRIFMLISSVVILILTMYPPPAVMWIGFFAATIFAASWGIIAFVSIHSKKVTEKAAFWSMLLGLTGIVAGELFSTFVFDLPVYFEPVLIGVVLSGVGLLFGMRNSQLTPEEQAYQRKLFKTPDILYDMNQIRITKRFAKAMIIFGFIVIAFTFFYYYYPVNIYTM